MLVATARDQIVGGALAFRRTQGDAGATLRLFGLEAAARGKGLGLPAAGDAGAGGHGARRAGINLGGVDGDLGDLKGFFTRTGYHGRRSMMGKGAARVRAVPAGAAAAAAGRRRRARRSPAVPLRRNWCAPLVPLTRPWLPATRLLNTERFPRLVGPGRLATGAHLAALITATGAVSSPPPASCGRPDAPPAGFAKRPTAPAGPARLRPTAGRSADDAAHRPAALAAAPSADPRQAPLQHRPAAAPAR